MNSLILKYYKSVNSRINRAYRQGDQSWENSSLAGGSFSHLPEIGLIPCFLVMPRNLAGNHAGTRSKENRFKLVRCRRKEGYQFSGRTGHGLDLRSALGEDVCAELEFGSSS